MYMYMYICMYMFMYMWTKVCPCHDEAWQHLGYTWYKYGCVLTIYIYIHIHTYINIYIYWYICMFMYTGIEVCPCFDEAGLHLRCTWYTYQCKECVCMCVCAPTYIYIYIYTHLNIEVCPCHKEAWQHLKCAWFELRCGFTYMEFEYVHLLYIDRYACLECEYVYIYTYVYISAYICIYIHIYICELKCVRLITRLDSIWGAHDVSIYIYTYAYIYICIYTYMNMHSYIYTWVLLRASRICGNSEAHMRPPTSNLTHSAMCAPPPPFLQRSRSSSRLSREFDSDLPVTCTNRGYLRIFKYICIYIYIYLYVYMFVCVYEYTYSRTRRGPARDLHEQSVPGICLYVHIYMYTYVYVCSYI